MDTAIFMLFVRLSLFIFSLCFCQGCEFRIVLHGIGVGGGPASAYTELPASSASSGACSYPARRPLVLDCVYDILKSTASQSTSATNSNAALNSSTRPSNRLTTQPNPVPTITEFVVKWFRNDEPAPLYTWIPAIGQRLFHHAYRDMVDPLYKHNDAALEMFRAVRIVRPVATLSGNFRCEIELATVEVNASTIVGKSIGTQRHDSNGSDGEGVLLTSSRTIYFYDQPAEFEVRLNFSARHIRCTARTSEHPISSVEMSLYRVSYDAFEMPVERIALINTTDVDNNRNSHNDHTTFKWTSLRNASSGSETIIEIGVALTTSELKVHSEGWSRDFICELVYNRVQTPERLVFQRSIRLIHEARDVAMSNAMSNLYEDLPEAEGWSASASSGEHHKQPQLVSAIIVTAIYLYLLYIIAEALGLP